LNDSIDAWLTRQINRRFVVTILALRVGAALEEQTEDARGQKAA
jgi:hypothetical protein